MATNPYVERVLFLVAEPNAGKSTQLRSIFLDHRLHNNGNIPTAKNLPNTHRLSNERLLYLRLTSPHESNEDLSQFLEKCEYEMSTNDQNRSRWNIAAPLQPYPTARTPGAADIINAFAAKFQPERVRTIVLSPDRHGNLANPKLINSLSANVMSHPRSDFLCADATGRQANAFIYADFFDFT